MWQVICPLSPLDMPWNMTHGTGLPAGLVARLRCPQLDAPNHGREGEEQTWLLGKVGFNTRGEDQQQKKREIYMHGQILKGLVLRPQATKVLNVCLNEIW